MIEIFENEEHDKLLWEKIQLRENSFQLSKIWRSKIWNGEILILHWLSHSVNLNLKDYSCVTPLSGQIQAQREKINLCGELELRNPLREEKLRKKLPRNWRIEKALPQRKKSGNSTNIRWTLCATWLRITNSESINISGQKNCKNNWNSSKIPKNSTDPDSPSSSGSTHAPHQHRIASSSKIKPSREPGLPRDTREDTSILGNAFDCHPTRRDPDELYNDSGNLRDLIENDKERRIWEKLRAENQCQAMPIPCFQERARQTSLDGGNCPSSMTNNQAAGIGTCTHSGMTIPSYLSSEMHPWKCSWQYGISRLESNFQERGLLKREKSKLCSTMDQRKRNSQITGWPHHSKINHWQTLHRLWRIAFDDGGNIEEVLR